MAAMGALYLWCSWTLHADLGHHGTGVYLLQCMAGRHKFTRLYSCLGAFNLPAQLTFNSTIA